MTFYEYQFEAMRTKNPDISSWSMPLEACLGLAGELGEVIDLVKKAYFQGHDLDREKTKEELGDALWYFAELATALNMDMDDIADLNIEKLKKRYPNGFTVERSIER